ncbi:MAG: OmpA family protein [Nitrospirae bacterium]|nr:OmpA family protein [Nitrospirota bacterium]
MRLLFHSIIILIVLTSTCIASTKDLKKAERLTQRGMFSQAIKILERQTHLMPANPLVYFLLGKCYLHTRNYEGAEKSFNMAFIQKPDYGAKIATEFNNEGIVCLYRNEVESAVHLFNAAKSYQQAIAASIAETFFHYGNDQINSELDKTETFFNLAISYDSSYSKKVCDAYFERLKARGKLSVDLLNKTMKCSNHSDNEIINALITKFPGEIRVINLKAGEVCDIGMVESGQELHYLYANHSFEHRIQRVYNNKGCGGCDDPSWHDPTGREYYNVTYGGRLQIKTDEQPLKVILAISGPTISEQEIEEKVIVLALEDVHFDFDKSTLTKEAQEILKMNIRILKEHPKTKVLIEGYTSASGTEEYNQKLSERRANAVKAYIVAEGIVTPDRLSEIGYGKTRPVMYEAVPKDLYSEAAKANMRVLFEIIVK